MAALGNYRTKKFFAWTLILVLVQSQAFACCMVNRKISDFIKTTIGLNAPQKATLHSCCPSHAAAQANATPSNVPTKTPCSTECCLTAAHADAAQLVSEKVSPPNPTPMVLFVLPIEKPAVIKHSPLPDLRIASSPPLYLTSLRLLI